MFSWKCLGQLMKEFENVKLSFSPFSAQNAQESLERGEGLLGVNVLSQSLPLSLSHFEIPSRVCLSPQSTSPPPVAAADGDLQQLARRAGSQAAVGVEQQQARQYLLASTQSARTCYWDEYC